MRRSVVRQCRRLVSFVGASLLVAGSAEARSTLVDQTGKSESAPCVSFAADGARVAVAVGERLGVFEVNEAGTPVRSITMRSSVATCSLSPSGKRLAAVTWDASVFTVDIATGQSSSIAWLAEGNARSAPLASFISSDERVVVVSARAYFVVDIAREPRVLYSQPLTARGASPLGAVRAASFSRDGSLLLVGYTTGHFDIFDVGVPEKPAVVRSGELDESAAYHVLSPDGASLAVRMGGKAVLWDSIFGRARFQRPAQQCCLADFSYSPGGTELVVAGTELNLTSIVLDAQSGQALGRWMGTLDEPRLVFDPRGRHVVGVEQHNPQGRPGRTLVWLDHWVPPLRQPGDAATSASVAQAGEENRGVPSAATGSFALTPAPTATTLTTPAVPWPTPAITPGLTPSVAPTGTLRLDGATTRQAVGDRYRLRLFDVELATATREDLERAIVSAGGVPMPSTTPGTDKYDATKIGLIGAETLEVVFDGARFLLATYQLTSNGFGRATEVDESLRKMLLSKYGPPYRVREQHVVNEREQLDRTDPKFADRYFGSGRRLWSFGDGMYLVYKQEFFGTRSLTYVDMARFDAAMTRAEKASAENARKEAAEKNSVF